MSVRIVNRLVVEWDDDRSWIPEVRDVAGMSFCRLQKWDRKFIMFAKGAALDLGRCRDSNIGVMDELRRLRNTACDQVLADMNDHQSKTKKKRQRKANSGDLLILPTYIEIMLPTMTLSDGSDVGGFAVNALTEGVRSASVFIEMRADVLEYIRNVTFHTTVPGRSWNKKAKTEGSDDPNEESQGISQSRSRSPSVKG